MRGGRTCPTPGNLADGFDSAMPNVPFDVGMVSYHPQSKAISFLSILRALGGSFYCGRYCRPGPRDGFPHHR